MQVSYCDVCQQVIEIGHKKHILGITSVNEEKEEYRESQYKDLYEQLRRQNKSRGFRGIQMWEICDSCRKVLQQFFKIRQDKLEMIKKELERMSEMKPYKRTNNGNSK